MCGNLRRPVAASRARCHKGEWGAGGAPGARRAGRGARGRGGRGAAPASDFNESWK